MALTITAFKTTNWTTTTTPLTISVTGALTGDQIVVIYGGNNGTGASPVTAATVTTTGGSTGAWTEPEEGLAANSQAWVSSSTAAVTADGTVTVSMDRTQGTAKLWGGMALLVRGHNGIGTHARSAPSAAETVNLTVSQGSAVGVLAIDWDALATVAFSPAGATDVERAQEGAPDITVYAGYWLNQTAGTTGYGIGTSATTNLHIIAIEMLAAASGGGGAFWASPDLMFPYPAFYLPPNLWADAAPTAPTAPGFVAQSTSRLNWLPRRLRRPAQVARVPLPPPDGSPRSVPARRQVPRRRVARLAVPPPVQAVPVDSDQLQRPRRRPAPTRSRSAQPLPVQVTAPSTPAFVPVTVTRRAKVWLRRGKSAETVQPQFNPPLVPQPFGHRVRIARFRSHTAQPIPPQFNPPIVVQPLAHRIRTALRRGHASQPVPTITAPIAPAFIGDALTHRLRLLFRRPRAGQRPTVVPQSAEQPPTLTTGPRQAVRPRRSFTATPVPTQQTAPANPAWVPVLIRKIRPALRRGGGRSASPTPAQQAVTPNPPFVFVDIRKVRALLVRRSKTASTVRPQHFPEVPNRAGVTPGLLARRGRTSQPPIVQTQPPTSPAVRNRQRRRVQVWQRRGKNAWRELGQQVVQFFQGVITGGTRPGPSSTGGTRSGPGATGKTLHGTVDFFGDVYGDGYPGGEGTTDLGAAGSIPAGPSATGRQQDGTNLTGGSR